MGRLDGKVAFITGGARGQGRAIAGKLASEGADIVLCDVEDDLPALPYPLATADEMAATVALVEGLGARVVARVADVRDQSQVDAAVRAGLDAFGKIDILVANAGVLALGSFWEIGEQEWDDVVRTNLTGVWHAAKAVAPHMIERGDGVMVLTASVNGLEGGAGYMHYVASKHGVLGVMRCAALELGPHNVRVHAVLPGTVDSPMTDQPYCRDWATGRAGATRDEALAAVRSSHLLRGRTALPPDAVADGVVWLVSDEARHATGVELVIDAGHLLLPGVNWDPIADDRQMVPPATAADGGRRR